MFDLIPIGPNFLILCLNFEFTTEALRTQSNLSFCPIGRRRSGKRTQPCGQFFISSSDGPKGGAIQLNWPPEADGLFPGRRLPAREKMIFSVISVSLWFIFYQMGNQLP
jgi:hypothetical protein